MRAADSVRGALYFGRGNKDLAAGRTTQAIANYEQAVPLAERAFPPLHFVALISALADAYAAAERMDDFFQAARRAATQARQFGLSDLEQEVLHEAAKTAITAGRHDLAVRLLEAVVPLAEATGDREDRAIARAQLGDEYAATGDNCAALEQYAIASRLFAAVGNVEYARQSGRSHWRAQLALDRERSEWPALQTLRSRITMEGDAAVARAGEFARRRHAAEIASFDLACAVLAEPEPAVHDLLAANGADAAVVGAEMAARAVRFTSDEPNPRFSERGARAGVLAMIEADALGRTQVSGVELLLGVVRESNRAATDVLFEYGLDLIRLRGPADPDDYDSSMPATTV